MTRKIKKATMKIFKKEIRFNFSNRTLMNEIYGEIRKVLEISSASLIEISEDPQCFMWIPLPKMSGEDIQKIIEVVDENVDVLENWY